MRNPAASPVLHRFRGKQVHTNKEFQRSNESLFPKKTLNRFHNPSVVWILPVVGHGYFLQKNVLAIPERLSHPASTTLCLQFKRPIRSTLAYSANLLFSTARKRIHSQGGGNCFKRTSYEHTIPLSNLFADGDGRTLFQKWSSFRTAKPERCGATTGEFCRWNEWSSEGSKVAAGERDSRHFIRSHSGSAQPHPLSCPIARARRCRATSERGQT